MENSERRRGLALRLNCIASQMRHINPLVENEIKAIDAIARVLRGARRLPPEEVFDFRKPTWALPHFRYCWRIHLLFFKIFRFDTEPEDQTS